MSPDEGISALLTDPYPGTFRLYGGIHFNFHTRLFRVVLSTTSRL